jgi:hypothetical protein
MCISSPKVCLRAAQNYIKNSKYEKDCIVARRSFVPVEKQYFSLAAGSKSKAEHLPEMDHPMDELSGRSQQKGVRLGMHTPCVIAERCPLGNCKP